MNMASPETNARPLPATTRSEQLERSIRGFDKMINEEGTGLATEVKERIARSIRAKNPQEDPDLKDYNSYIQRAFKKIGKKQSYYRAELDAIENYPDRSGVITAFYKIFSDALKEPRLIRTIKKEMEQGRRMREPVGKTSR